MAVGGLLYRKAANLVGQLAALTSGKTIVGAGASGVAESSLTATVVNSSSGTLGTAAPGTDYTNLAFKTISVATQSDVVADSAADTLTLVAGSNVTITTNAGTDTITIAATGGGGSGTVTNTGTLTNHALIKGNGGVDVSALGDLGTTETVLYGNSAADPAFAVPSVPIKTSITSVLPANRGWVVPEALEIAAGVSLEIAGGARLEITGSTVEPQVMPWGFTPPIDSQFSWTNQGTAFVNATPHNIYLQGPATAPDSLRVREKSIGNTVSGVLSMGFIPNTTDTTVSGGMGLTLRESGTSKILIMRYITTTNGQKLFITHGASPTSLTVNDLNGAIMLPILPVFMRVAISGANYIFSMSGDGVNYIQVLTLGKTTPFTTAADKWGFAVDAASASFDIGMTVLHFKES